MSTAIDAGMIANTVLNLAPKVASGIAQLIQDNVDEARAAIRDGDNAFVVGVHIVTIQRMIQQADPNIPDTRALGLAVSAVYPGIHETSA
ncbi:hypothetical protein SEA_DALANDE_100 [Gordonia phage DalanDe]|nr:hypothetical protein SEA_DALANDE_100 [Gordonia phage DalanDe]